MTTPAEDQMRQQMYKSLVALEKMCDAVTAYLAADEERRAKAETELDGMGKVVSKHHQALGILTTFSELKDVGLVGTTPRNKLVSLLGLRACPDCVGTGWIARDETCKNCGRTGYIKS